MVLIDANVILRYLLNDVPDQSNQAAALLKGTAASTTDIIAEVVYVLAGNYQVPRSKIRDALSSLMHHLYLEEEPVIRYALDLYARRKLDFTDCLLIARAMVLQADVFSFDKKLMKTIRELMNTPPPKATVEGDD